MISVRSFVPVALLLYLTPLAAAGQTAGGAGYVVDNWNTDNGLPQNSVNAVLQSRDGYLWLATNGGLARYDGVAFRTINSGSRTGLPSDRIQSLAQDSAGRIWVGTESGLAVYDNGRFTTYTTANGMPGDGVSTIAAHPDGSVIFGTWSGALGRVDARGVRTFVKPQGKLGGVVSRVVVDPKADVWVWSTMGVWRLDVATGALEQASPPRRAVLNAALAADYSAGAWVPTDSGIAHITRNGRTDYPIRRLLADPAQFCRGARCPPLSDLVDISAIRSIAASELLLGTRTGELFRFRPDSLNTAGVLRRIKGPSRGLTTDILQDREHNIWAGSDVSGLLRARVALFNVFTAADGLAADIVAAVFADSRDRVWIGGNCNGVAVHERGTFRVIGERDGIPNTCVFSLAEDTAGAIWIGSYGGGVGRWKDRLLGWYTVKDGLPSHAVLALFSDRSGTLWAGTDQGAATWDGTQFVHRDIGAGSVPVDVRTIYQTRDGALWFGMRTGLVRLLNGHSTVYTTKQGLPNDYVRAIHEDRDGSLWLGTYGGGLARMRGDSITTYTTADGLYDNVISSIIDDASDNLWMSTNRGVFRVARTAFAKYDAGVLPRLQSVVYNRADGMLSSETNGGFQPAVTRSADGRLWYPTVLGVAVIDPARATSSLVAPAAVLEGIAVNGRPHAVTEALSVGPGATDLEFTYSGVSFTAADAVTFRYRLDGWDEDWVEAGTRRSAYYSRLEPGHYTFNIMAANRDGVWSATATTFDVTVRALPWQTWWFKLLVAIAVGSAVYYAIRARVQQVRIATEVAAADASRRQVTAILESITDGFVALDRNWNFTYVNHTAEDLLHQERNALLGRNFWERFPRAVGTQLESALREGMSTQQPVAFEAADTPSPGQWLDFHAYPTDTGISVYFSDITPRKLAEQALVSQTLRDELTGVFNRRGLLAHAEQQALTAHRSRQGFDIVFIDMDGMKEINDSLGHAVGDDALRDTVALLKKTFRESDIIGRLGGDEFAVVVLDASEESTAPVIERLRANVASHNASAGRPYELSLSIGTSRYDPMQPQVLAELIGLADRRMYEQKRGKGAAR